MLLVFLRLLKTYLLTPDNSCRTTLICSCFIKNSYKYRKLSIDTTVRFDRHL